MDRGRTRPDDYPLSRDHSCLTNISALALIDEHPDGAILDGNLLDGPITPVALALCDRSVPLVVFTGLGLPAELQRSHPDIPVILKPSPYEAVIRAIAERIQGCPPPRTRVGNRPGTGLDRMFVARRVARPCGM